MYKFEVDLAFELDYLVVMLDESRQHLDVLVKTILPKSLPQLDVFIELGHKEVNRLEFLQSAIVDLYCRMSTFSVMLSGNLSNISCHLLMKTNRAKHLAS